MQRIFFITVLICMLLIWVPVGMVVCIIHSLLFNRRVSGVLHIVRKGNKKFVA